MDTYTVANISLVTPLTLDRRNYTSKLAVACDFMGHFDRLCGYKGWMV